MISEVLVAPLMSDTLRLSPSRRNVSKRAESPTNQEPNEMESSFIFGVLTGVAANSFGVR